MPGFTSEEVQATIDKFLLGTVSVANTSLGTRDVVAAREDIFALLTTTLLLRPESYFYIIGLARNRLESLRREQQAALDFILDSSTASALKRRGKPVTSTVELTNARAALLNINAGINETNGSRTRSLGPEVDRFRRSVSRFVEESLVPNVVESGTPTETAGELRVRIEEVWAEVVTRDAEIRVLCTAIQDALAALSAAQLPQKAVQGIVSRMETRLDELTTALEEDVDVSIHRESMLELLTMRTLLTRVSSFRDPQQLLAPLPGDGTQVSGVTGTTPAALTGTISGPFNVDPTALLDFESGAPVVPSSIALSQYSNAESRSAEIVYPITFPLVADLQLRVDGVLYPAGSFSLATYLFPATFLAAVQLYLTTNVIPATAFLSGPAVVIRSNSFADISSVEVLATTAGHRAFLALTGFERVAVCRPVEAASIIADGVPFPGVRLTESRTEYGNVSATTAPGAVLECAKAVGLLDTSMGGRTFTAAVSLEGAGVRVRDAMQIGTQLVAVVAVTGAVVTVSEDIVAPNIGPAVAFRIGVDFTTTPAGSRVLVTSTGVPLNTGPYRVIAGAVGQLTVDRPFAAVGDAVSAVVVRSLLVAHAPGATVSDGITAWPPSAGAIAVGYVPSPTQVQAGFSTLLFTGIDLLARGVSTGDQLVVNTTPTTTTTAVSAVALDTAVVSPAVPYFTGSLSYRLESARYLSWAALVADVAAFIATTTFKAADFAVTRLLTGAAPTPLLSVGGPIDLYRADILALDAIQSYEVPFERVMDNILRMLVEQGFDRAADLLTTLQIEEMFSMHVDGVSYSTNLVREASEVTRQVAPQSRFAKSIWGHPEVRLLSRRRLRG